MSRRILKALVVIPLLIFGGLKGLEVLYYTYDLKNQIRYELKSAAVESDSEIRKRVLARLKRAGVECFEQDIVVRRKGGTITLAVPYRHDVGLYVLGRQRSLFSYHVGVSVESPIM